jgi:hypothetical protein
MKPFIRVMSLACMTFSLTLSGADPENTKQAEDSTKTETAQAQDTTKKEASEKKSEDEAQKGGSEKTQTLTGNEEAEQTVKIGNLAFPVSQQPTPLISFGQNVLDKKQKQALLLTNKFKGKDQYFINIVPSIIYGFTDSLSLDITAPFAVRYRQDCAHSSGPQDLIVQLEYAFYTKAYPTFYDQATVVANVTIPTGSTRKTPSTGFGSNSFFIGGTYSRMEIDWFYFASSGALLTTSSHRTRIGDQFLYQFGLGRRICNTKEWLFDWMVEITGAYSAKDKIRGVTDRNSGGNVIFLTPSLFISSSESLVIQFGMGFPIVQHLFGDQTKTDYLAALNLGWTF